MKPLALVVRHMAIWSLTLICLISFLSLQAASNNTGTSDSLLRWSVGGGRDWRLLCEGSVIPSEGYADQPYIVKTKDGIWLCVMTTGQGNEGSSGQHVISLRSKDQGKTWLDKRDIEPALGPEASYAVLVKANSGRIYCFYNFNTQGVREIKDENGKSIRRVDSLGDYVFKYSDDDGLSWSTNRTIIPIRDFDCDRNNVYQGKIRFFWNVGRPLAYAGQALIPLHKVGAMGAGFFAQSEGAFIVSNNILQEQRIDAIQFETLPNGTQGLRTPPGGGRIAEEQSVCVTSDGTLYCVYRTVDGWPACAYSSDFGRTWTPPEYASYTPGGRRIKHPRAANFVWKCSNGRYLYWFHNHGGKSVQNQPGWDPYSDRNPVWLSAGKEIHTPQGTRIIWSQPEILLYDDDPFIRISYPDLIEENRRYYVTETQKNVGRVHEISPILLEGLFEQFEKHSVAQKGLALNWDSAKALTVPMPRLLDFHQRDTSKHDMGGKDLRSGFSLEFWLKFHSLRRDQTIFDSRNQQGQGIWVGTSDRNAIRISINDGRSECSWECDHGILKTNQMHHVVINVDSGPKIITFVIDGQLNDGGDHRQFGWGRFSPILRSANGSNQLKIAPGMDSIVQKLRVYTRCISTSEAVGNYQADISF